MEKSKKDLLNKTYSNIYQEHVTISNNESNDKRAVDINDLEKRKEAYGICGECNKPGTGFQWCQSCNAKRFKENFKSWTSGNKDFDDFIQHSQLNAVHYRKYLEWIPFENFQNVTYITRGGFGKVYSAKWPEGCIYSWNIENQKWNRRKNRKVVLKSLDNSSDISAAFLNEIKSHLQIYLADIVQCYGVTRDPRTNDYMMVLFYCKDGNLRNYLNGSKLDCISKIGKLFLIARGLLDIHNAGKVHKDFHPGNILFNEYPLISDLGMCQPANNNREKSVKNEVYGVLPYVAPEVLCGHEYTKASDIYSFGIIMNEFMSEEIPYNDIPHDHILTIKICKGFRPSISENTPKLLADLIMKCWDAKAENRPTAKELYLILKKWNFEKDSEIYSQIEECNKIREIKNNSDKNIQTHSQAIYTSRLLSFRDLPEPVNSSNLSSFQLNSANPISECLDVQLSDLDLDM